MSVSDNKFCTEINVVMYQSFGKIIKKAIALLTRRDDTEGRWKLIVSLIDIHVSHAPRTLTVIAFQPLHSRINICVNVAIEEG